MAYLPPTVPADMSSAPRSARSARNSRSSRSSRNSRKYRDDNALPYSDDVDDNEDAADDEEDDEDEEVDILHVRDSRDAEKPQHRFRRRVRETAAKPSARALCWRYFLFLVICAVSIAMVVQLYQSYGAALTSSLFPPRVSSAGQVCSDGKVTKDYQLAWTRFETVDNATAHGWAHLNATQPKDALQWAWRVAEGSTAPQLTAVEWKDKHTLRVWLAPDTPDVVACANVVVLSV